MKAMAEIDLEWENCHTAWEWAVAGANLPLLTQALPVIATYVERRGPLSRRGQAHGPTEPTPETLPVKQQGSAVDHLFELAG